MLLAQYAWLVFLAQVLLNDMAVKRRIRPVIESHPELADGYRQLLNGLAFWFSLPWVVMGVGCTTGWVPTVFHYLKPAAAGPFAWVFWGVVFAEFLLLAWWGVWGCGAERLIRHPGVVRLPTASVGATRWFLCGMGLLGVVWNAAFLAYLA